MTREDRLERTREVMTFVEEMEEIGWRREKVAIVEQEGEPLVVYIRLSCESESASGGKL